MKVTKLDEMLLPYLTTENMEHDEDFRMKG